MKKIIIAASLAGLAFSAVQAGPGKTNPAALLKNRSAAQSKIAEQLKDFKVNEKEIGYIMGFRMGKAMHTQGAKFNVNSFTEGLNDALASKASRFDEATMGTTLQKYRMFLMQKRTQDRQVQAEKNKQEGTKFLADNKSKPGVVQLPSGVQYKVIAKGTGPSPKKADKVTIEYTGKLINGEVFSSSKESGKPLSINVKNTIKGWQEVLPLMKTGGTWEIYVPAKFAYGTRGAGAKIGPGATLIFNVKLVEVKAQPVKNAKDEKKTVR